MTIPAHHTIIEAPPPERPPFPADMLAGDGRAPCRSPRPSPGRCVETFADRTAAERLSLAHLTCWLLSDYAAYMTGAISGIDEGLTG